MSYADTTSSTSKNLTTEEQIFRFAVPLAELDVARVYTEIVEDVAKLRLNTIGDRPAIKATAELLTSGLYGPHKSQEAAELSRVTISFEGIDAAEQAAQYFKEAIRNCQSRKSP